jgi:hypothetical protein
MYKIEKGIKIPEFFCHRKYPLSEMEVGDSFFVEGTLKKNTINTAVSWWSKRKGNTRKFTIRKVDGGIRVWRIK